uniref:RxLR effector protein n=1 Tax=Alexandrium catenella TaxID=2925 RepID=A0A7S1R4T1_ALECA|mmetsp:Transcript_4481/g.11988  ORF Transcript_4481/g.11988 Transcript_4481/m.11988 type:complete len:144 (+) Transcript_4481:108-539(+)
MASQGLLLLLVASVAMTGVLGAENDAELKAGVSLNAHHTALRAQMRTMMTDEEDEVDYHALSRNGRDSSKRSMLQMSGPSTGSASMDDYIKEAEAGLTSALGPRWNAKALEEDADRKTSALLRGISGPRAMKAINRMMGALGR